MVAPSQTASLLWVQQAAVILPGNSRSLALERYFIIIAVNAMRH